MYVSLQFIIVEILLGLIFLAVLYFMLRGVLKKLLRRELEDIKQSTSTLANYLVGKAQMEAAEQAAAEKLLGEAQNEAGEQDAQGDQTGSKRPPAGPGKGQAKQQSAGGGRNPGQKRVAVEPSPEKLSLEPVDVADEFIALKNANRINAYNLRVQKIWELYKSKKINITQYNEELVRLKKEFSIGGEWEDVEELDDPTIGDPDQNGTGKLAPVKKLAGVDGGADPAKDVGPKISQDKGKSSDQNNSSSPEPGSKEGLPNKEQPSEKDTNPAAPAALEPDTNLDGGVQRQQTKGST